MTPDQVIYHLQSVAEMPIHGMLKEALAEAIRLIKEAPARATEPAEVPPEPPIVVLSTPCPACKDEWPERLNCRTCGFTGSDPTPSGEELLRFLKAHFKEFIDERAEARCRAPEGDA